jgi:hypothetical protein
MALRPRSFPSALHGKCSSPVNPKNITLAKTMHKGKDVPFPTILGKSEICSKMLKQSAKNKVLPKTPPLCATSS